MSDRHITVNVTVTDDDNNNAVLSEQMIAVVVPPLGEPGPEPEPDQEWHVVIKGHGSTYDIDRSMGIQRGTFRSDFGKIAQECCIVYISDLDLHVHFRPEEDGSRQEIVFERSRCFAGNAMVHDIGPYTAAIWRGTELQEEFNIPHHYAFCRWRWQSKPRDVFASVKDLINAGYLPPYDRDALRPSAITKIVPYEPMGLAGIYPSMPDAGERPDIGPVTDPQAEYVVTGNETSLQVLLAQAEASGSVPWHMRDENISAPIDFETYPKACWYFGQQGMPQVIIPSGNPVKIDGAHQPALNYVPFMLTGDPYYLEGLMFQATWNYGSLSLGYRPTLSQTRQFAWDMRTLGQLAAVVPDVVPDWMLPRDYWERRLEAHRQFFEGMYVESESALQTVFRATDNVNGKEANGAFPAGTWCQPWQSEFLATMFGWIVALGHENWKPTFEWIVKGTIDRTGGNNGWPRALCTPYMMMLQAEKNGIPARDYAEAWSINEEIAGLTYADAEVWAQEDMNYLSYTRGALVYAVMHGLPAALENLEWANKQFIDRNQLPLFKWSMTD